ncbi:MAG: hypothetical protein O7D30_05000 [Rickettsia endosymbiont of Ixodes persulcatus]|nr:hypothetical protein [Rickettsia endosymbiont of Ixodes persulcatus]
MSSSLIKSCPHHGQDSLNNKGLRLGRETYPTYLVKRVASRLLANRKSEKETERPKRFLTVPCPQRFSHHIKTLLADVCNTLFTCKNNLSKIIQKIDEEDSLENKCQKKHEQKFPNAKRR